MPATDRWPPSFLSRSHNNYIRERDIWRINFDSRENRKEEFNFIWKK